MIFHVTIDSWVRIDDPDTSEPSGYADERTTVDGEGWEGRACRRFTVNDGTVREAVESAMRHYEEFVVHGADEPLELSLRLEPSEGRWG